MDVDARCYIIIIIMQPRVAPPGSSVCSSDFVTILCLTRKCGFHRVEWICANLKANLLTG